MSEGARPLIEAVKELAHARERLAELVLDLLAARAEFDRRHAPLIAAEESARNAVRGLEATIRTRGAEIAAVSREAPCPGTKVRFEKAVRFRTIGSDGTIADMQPAEESAYLIDFAVRRGWTGLVKPDRAACEKVLRRMDESMLPPEVVIEWETKVSIDSDLGQVLEEGR